MENPTKWSKRIFVDLEKFNSRVGPREAKKFQIDLLARITRRVAEFLPECPECQKLQGEISRMVEDLGTFSEMPKDRRQAYNKSLSQALKHLRRGHRLVVPGEYTSIWMSVGMAIGFGLGSIFSETIIGFIIGLGAGSLAGTYLDQRAKKNGRVI